jgi:non-ribosomal peptide synthase protein (TIGR01720 family)
VTEVSLPDGGPVSEEQLWESYAYFLERVVPVAAAARVKMALHPDDPPLSPIRGVGRIMRSVANFNRALALCENPYHGITFCQGNFTAMGADIPTAIRHFGQAGKILAPELNWTLMPGFVGGEVSARNTRPHLLEINAMVTDGCLTVTWTFSEAVHSRSTIDDLASRYEHALRSLVEAARATTTKQYTPSDFPAAGLDQKSLDALLSKLNR